eukprot:GHRR01014570.1.p1 GENE.GHRR01014570.1~~GHRR01014570.1.p1  ORF type:complete len:382 (+),score=117.61 GHRR01014570.1:352-1497(+)
MQCLIQRRHTAVLIDVPAPWPRQQARCTCWRRGAPGVQASMSLAGPAGDADANQTVSSSPVQVARTKRQLWMAAIKPPMYSVGIVPVLVGAASAFYAHGAICWPKCAGLVAGAICIIAWLNLSNDAFDATTGVDVHKAESVVNLTGNRNGVLLLAKLFLVAGMALLGTNINAAAYNTVLQMLGLAIACGYIYQGPPLRLSYKGVGEPLCFVAFGPLATTAFHLAQSPATISTSLSAAASSSSIVSILQSDALLAMLGVLVGITTTVILFCSHWHQIEGDIKAGKMSPLVRLGTAKACEVLVAATAAPYMIALAAAIAGICPTPLLLCLLLSLPSAKTLVDFAYTNHAVPAKIAPLKKFGVKWHSAVGLCLAAGLLLSKYST